jgi:hypothetical protein
VSKRPFQANTWLQGPETAPREALNVINGVSYSSDIPLPPPIPLPGCGPAPFKLANYFIPGWKGESLFSNTALKVKKVQEFLWKDALKQFKDLKDVNRSLKYSIYTEYLNFLDARKNVKKREGQTLEDHAHFWLHLHSKSSEYREVLDEFLEYYSFKVATLYLFKLNFIIKLCQSMGHPLLDTNLLSPHATLNRIFPKGGSYELNCDALKTNLYSWYRPTSSCLERLKTLKDNITHLSIPQLMKLTSYRKLERTERVFDFQDVQYSHALSHKAFGLFVNSLLVFFPLWAEKESFKYPAQDNKDLDVLNTKFVGDHLTSFVHSHWLAQEHNLKMKWSEIICPDFNDKQFSNGTFIKMCHELQFLTFLVKVSMVQKTEVKGLISRVMREKYGRTSSESEQQISLFTRYESRENLIYDRVLLNLTNIPKKNPHHYLIQQIYQQKELLSDQGYLYVLSNQKLFVHSQNQRVKQLLEDFKLVSFIDLEKLEGKGEIGNYLYILTKRPKRPSLESFDPQFLTGQNTQKNRPDNCMSFNWEGDLTQFLKFEDLVNELNQFFQNKNFYSTSIFQTQTDSKLSFNLHQDAIIDGKLLNSMSKNQNNIAHPQFFKNLTNGCHPLDKFFSIANLENNHSEKKVTNDLLGIHWHKKERFSHVLIVDLRDPMDPKLEIYPFDSYIGKREEYGVAYYHYLGLTEKVLHLNINLFREYFQSELGRQIIQLFLNGSNTKIKSKICTLLVPKYFLGDNTTPYISETCLRFFQGQPREIMKMHPAQFEEQFQTSFETLNQINEKAPWLTSGLLAHFKFSLSQCLERFESEYGAKEVDYNNPLVRSPLLDLPSQGIYPNEEIFTEFTVQKKSELNLPLSHTSIIRAENSYESFLELYAGDKVVLKLHSDKELLLFIQYILNSAQGVPILQILQGLKVPQIEDFRKVISSFYQMESTFSEIYKESDRLLQAIIKRQITIK